MNRISAHLSYFICLEHSTKKQKVDKLIEIKNNNIMSMNKFRTGIEASNIWNKLDKDNFADPNENCHILETEIIKQRLKHLPTKKIKYKKHKHKKSGWITHGIIRSIVFRDKWHLGDYKGILNRTQPSTNFPEYFNINGPKITDRKVISNEFNSFFTNIGANITAQIYPCLIQICLKDICVNRPIVISGLLL